MQGWQVALLVISAIFVGMWIPVSLQLIATLRSAKKILETEVSTTMIALNKTIADVGEVAQAAAQIKDSIRIMSSIGAAVGPAVVALVRALREPKAETENQAGNGSSTDACDPTPAQKESML